MTWRRASLAVFGGLAAACSTIIGPEPSTRADALFDELWSEFDRHYSFFELRQLDWDSLRAVHRPDPQATETQLLAAFDSLFAALDDPHVTLLAGNRRLQSALARIDAPTRFDAATIFAGYVTDAKMTPSRRMRFGRLTPEIGYVLIPGFGGDGWGGEIDGVLADLAGVDALVIDIRDNAGGDNGIALDIAGRFTTSTRLIGWYRYRNGPRHGDFTDFIAHELAPKGPAIQLPMVVLTNRQVASAAEDFTLMLRAIPGVTQIGDTTMGASGNPLKRELSNGWFYQLSEWIEYTPEKQPFETVGLAPAIVVQATLADSSARVDRALEQARDHLQAQLAAAGQSARSASVGSTRAARHAGRIVAATATTSSTPATTP